MTDTISIGENLTSAEFYRNLLPEIQLALKYYDVVDEIILDFSGTRHIEPNVIPNLLCLGRIIKEQTGKKAFIDIPDTFSGVKIKDYMVSISFVKLARDVFDFLSNPYGGVTGNTIDPLCRTVYFNENSVQDEIAIVFSQIIQPFSGKYLSGYERLRMDSGRIENMVTNLLQELTMNAVEHGKSYSYITMHARYSDRKIYIAVSDNGMGLYNSCLKEHMNDIRENNISLMNELDAILYCIYMRSPNQKFGLYAIIMEILRAGGRIRVHSNNTQAIFTDRLLWWFENRKLRENNSFMKYNIRNNLRFSGVHIEIEIPF